MKGLYVMCIVQLWAIGMENYHLLGKWISEGDIPEQWQETTSVSINETVAYQGRYACVVDLPRQGIILLSYVGIMQNLLPEDKRPYFVAPFNHVQKLLLKDLGKRADLS